MAILIESIEMPKKCSECLVTKLSPTGESLICGCILSRVSWDERPFDCPLIEVPEPHGRLIDVDYADNYAYDELELANSYLTGWEAARAMQKIYQNAPTIIPASEEAKV